MMVPLVTCLLVMVLFPLGSYTINPRKGELIDLVSETTNALDG